MLRSSFHFVRTQIPFFTLALLGSAALHCSRGGAGGNGPQETPDLAGWGMHEDGGTRDLSSHGGDSDLAMRSDMSSAFDMRGGFDLGPAAMCSPAIAPTLTNSATTTHNIPDPDEPYVFSAGGAVYSVLSFDTKWNNWTGTGWSESPIPWPAEIAKTSDGMTRNLRFHSCNYRGATELADGRAIFMATDGTNYWLVTFDGSTIQDPIKMPGPTTPCARSFDNRYYQLSGNRLYSGDPSTGWDLGTPVPLPSLSYDAVDMAAMRDGRLVIAYTTYVSAKATNHVFVLSKPLTGAFGTAQDITPAWAVSAQNPKVVGARDGGLIVSANGGSSSYVVPAIWRSADGVTFGMEDSILTGFVSAGIVSVRATCLENPVLVLYNTASSPSGYEVYARKGGSYTQLDRVTGSYLEGAGVTMLPDGRVFWGYAQPNLVTRRASM